VVPMASHSLSALRVQAFKFVPSRISVVLRHLCVLSLPFALTPFVFADQLPSSLTGWYQTHDGRTYKIRQRGRNVWLTRYEPSNGMPLTYFEGRINAEGNTIQGDIQSCWASGTGFYYGAGEKPFTFKAKNTDAQKSLGFTDADGKWIQFFPRYPLRNSLQPERMCNLARLARSTWLTGQTRDSQLALYRDKSDPLIFWAYSIKRYNADREGVWAKWPVARLDFYRVGSDSNPSDTLFQVHHCYQGLNDSIRSELYTRTRTSQFVSLRRASEKTFELRPIHGQFYFRVYDPARTQYRFTTSELGSFKSVSGDTLKPSYLERGANGRRLSVSFFDPSFFVAPGSNVPAVQRCEFPR